MLGSAVIVGIGVKEHLVAGGDSSPDDVVRDYLAAVLDRDVERALEFTSPKYHGDLQVDDTFLNSDAIDTDWQIVELETFDVAGALPVVHATIEAFDGTVATGRYQMIKRDQTWRIIDPFVLVSYPGTDLEIVAVDGQQVTVDPGAEQVQYALFPGRHRLQQVTSELVESPGSDHLVVNGLLEAGKRDAESPGLTAAGAELLQQQVDQYIDQCAAEARLAKVGCPFGADTFHEPPGADYGYSDIVNIQWTVKRYPVVTGAWSPEGFAVGEAEPGVVELSGVVEDGGGERDVTIQCHTNSAPLRFLIDEGQITVYDKYSGPPGELEQQYTPQVWTTCPG